MNAYGAPGGTLVPGAGALPRAAPGGGELLLWCLLLLAALLVRSHVAGGPELSNDAYQYLSAAEHLRRGEGAATSLVHFDAERSHGRIPAPLTTFPPGYPLAVALLAHAGLGLEQAGVLVSFAATLAVAAMLPAACGLLGVPAAAVRVLLLLLISSCAFLRPANQVASEALFSALAFGALALLLAAEQPARGARACLALQLGASVLIAAACSVRYAGLFLFAAVAVFHAARWLAGTRRALPALAALSLSAVPIAALLWRNQLLVGSWKGGNTKEVFNPVLEVVHRFALSVHHLFLGDGPARFGTAEAALALALAGLAAAALPALWRRRAALASDARLQLIALFVAVYVCALLYLGTRSVISFGPRMFVPLLPVLLLLAGGLWRHAAPDGGRPAVPAAAALLVAAYAAINLPAALAEAGRAPHERVRARLDAAMGRLLPPGAVIAATEGQAAGYLLRRGTVSLVSPHFSDQQWTEEAVRAAMDRFGARHLLLCHEAGQAPSAFLAALERGAAPAWLQLLADNGRARLFRRGEPGGSNGNRQRARRLRHRAHLQGGAEPAAAARAAGQGAPRPPARHGGADRRRRQPRRHGGAARRPPAGQAHRAHRRAGAQPVGVRGPGARLQ